MGYNYGTAVLPAKFIRTSIKKALYKVSDFDCDLTNEDCLWEEAAKAGYKTNAEYAADEALKPYTSEDILHFGRDDIDAVLDRYAEIIFNADDYWNEYNSEVVATGKNGPMVLFLIADGGD